MSLLYLDLGMGAAGDMLSAALLELLPNPDAFIQKLNALGLDGVVFEAVKTQKSGVCGTKMKVIIDGTVEEEDCHVHTHRGLQDIKDIVASLSVTNKVKEDIYNVYHLIAEAESRVHGKKVEQIHFHELGNMDAIADIAAVCLLMEEIKPMKVIASAVHVGSGTVRCAHGILPVPAPATALLLDGIPIYSADIQGELCTPTGAALIRYFVQEFKPMPMIKVNAIGYGMGSKDYPKLNCVRAFSGEIEGTMNTVLSLSCNLDDMTGEDIAFASEKLLEEGALDVYTVPVMMKKSRPGVMLCVLCKEEDSDKFAHLIFRHTTTLGIRKELLERYVLDREIIEKETPYGKVRSKVSFGYGTKKEKPEFEDLLKAAKVSGKTLEEIRRVLNENQ